MKQVNNVECLNGIEERLSLSEYLGSNIHSTNESSQRASAVLCYHTELGMKGTRSLFFCLPISVLQPNELSTHKTHTASKLLKQQKELNFFWLSVSILLKLILLRILPSSWHRCDVTKQPEVINFHWELAINSNRRCSSCWQSEVEGLGDPIKFGFMQMRHNTVWPVLIIMRTVEFLMFFPTMK